jgi:hypothetical protein
VHDGLKARLPLPLIMGNLISFMNYVLTIVDKMLTYASETWTLTKRDRKQMNIFEKRLYRRILDPVYDNEKEN